MFLRSPRFWSVALLVSGFCGASCGARTAILTSNAGPDAGTDAPVFVACAADLDCATGDACAGAACREGTCVPLPATVCNDNDECTTDACDPSSGKCTFTSITLDLDGDGHKSPRPGFAPGAPGSCGDDCDDRSAAAHPGGIEACDGVDNDCNGQVDEGAAYGSPSMAVRVSSAAFDRASGAGLAFDGKNYGAIYTGHKATSSSYFQGLAPNGVSVVPETPLTDINAETYAGSVLHNGSFFERVWEDARQDQNYEVYFNRFDSNGKKLGPDLRVTNAAKFSLNSALAWNGTETLLVWDDRRFEQQAPDARIFGQRVSFDGSLVGGNIALTPAGIQAEHPGIALGTKRVGVAFTSQQTSTTVHAQFLNTAPDLSDVSKVVDLGGSGVESTNLVALGDRFLVAWDQNTSVAGYGASIFGAVVDQNGNVLRTPQPLTSGATIARSFSLLSLGNRALLVWADNHDGNFEIYAETLSQNMEVLTPRVRLSFSPTDSFFPAASFGPNGDVGVLYQDWQTNFPQVYFVSMGCAIGVPVK
ncbi:MAG: putative metal-binding motif-containing protein [Pseudomonadota bacterium]